MREIKFRAWDEEMKEMLKVHRMSFVGNCDELGGGILDEHNDFHKMVDVKVMQFIGLKDKNGKEIFEGDVVKLMNEQNGVVYWEDGRWNVTGKHIAELTELSRFDGRCEVIGNKFENPELLEDKTEE